MTDDPTKQGASGDEADRAAETADEINDPMHPKHKQEKLLDEGVEETFPASDPVSVKRIT